MITQATIDRLYKEQKGVCPICGRALDQFHVHHAVFTRDVRFQKWLDMAENLQLICPRCHANHGRLSNFYARKKAWKAKVELGYDMEKWLESIPMIFKDRF
jgi:rubrerythrin